MPRASRSRAPCAQATSPAIKHKGRRTRSLRPALWPTLRRAGQQSGAQPSTTPDAQLHVQWWAVRRRQEMMNLDRGREGQIAARLAWQGSRPVDARSGIELRQRLFGQGRNALTAAAQPRLAGATRVIRRALRLVVVRQLGTASRCGPGRSILPCPQAAAERLRAGEHQHAEEHRQSAQKGSHDNLILRSRQALVQLDSVKWDLRRTRVGISQRGWKTGEGHGEPTTAASRVPIEMGGAESVLGRELSDSHPFAGARRNRKMTHWRAVLIDRHKKLNEAAIEIDFDSLRAFRRGNDES